MPKYPPNMLQYASIHSRYAPISFYMPQYAPYMTQYAIYAPISPVYTLNTFLYSPIHPICPQYTPICPNVSRSCFCWITLPLAEILPSTKLFDCEQSSRSLRNSFEVRVTGCHIVGQSFKKSLIMWENHIVCKNILNNKSILKNKNILKNYSILKNKSILGKKECFEKRTYVLRNRSIWNITLKRYSSTVR